MTAAKRAVNRKPTLRDAQKAHTRQRMVDAARAVFFREGFYGATVDQIVTEAGTSRPTFYLHFRDKDEILRELVADYVARAVPYMESLPGPRSTVEELKEWLWAVGGFLRQEQAVASVLAEVSAHRQANRAHYGLVAIEAWITALSRRAPAFAAAVCQSPPDISARVRAQLLILEIAWAGENISINEDAALTEAAVTMVATSLHEFLHDPRFLSNSPQAGEARV